MVVPYICLLKVVLLEVTCTDVVCKLRLKKLKVLLIHLVLFEGIWLAEIVLLRHIVTAFLLVSLAQLDSLLVNGNGLIVVLIFEEVLALLLESLSVSAESLGYWSIADHYGLYKIKAIQF